MVFVRAKSEPANAGDPEEMFIVQYFDEKGNMIIRSRGTRAWRCNNPGNLRKSDYSTGKSRRSIGIASYGEDFYPIYPDYETGHEALVVMLRGSVYSPLTLRAAMKRYDRKHLTYIDEIVKITKFDPERTIKSLNDKEFEQFWKAIEFIEKWRVGDEDFIDKWFISGVHKKRGVIVEYLVQQPQKDAWIAKEQAIQLAIQGRLHAVVVHLKNGTNYLRPEYKAKPFAIIV
jgi:hypothetical protein